MANKKAVIITDVNGGTLRLTKTHLIETGELPYALRLRDLAKALKENKGDTYFTVLIGMVGHSYKVDVGVSLPNSHLFGKDNFANGKIGCRELYPADFNKIVRAAKASVRKSRKTQTVAKAKGAAAGKAKRK